MLNKYLSRRGSVALRRAFSSVSIPGVMLEGDLSSLLKACGEFDWTTCAHLSAFLRRPHRLARLTFHLSSDAAYPNDCSTITVAMQI